MSKKEQRSRFADEALRKIGRNVVNFQKMEGMLKVLVSEGNYSGPLEDLKSIVEERRRTTSRKTLGQLSEEFVRSTYSQSERLEEPQNDSAKVWFSFSNKVEGEGKYAHEVRQALAFIVAERNELIHTRLMDFDVSSDDICKRLIVDLDIQAKRIDPEYKRLQVMLKNLSEGKKRIAESLMSEEFLSKLIADEEDG